MMNCTKCGDRFDAADYWDDVGHPICWHCFDPYSVEHLVLHIDPKLVGWYLVCSKSQMDGAVDVHNFIQADLMLTPLNKDRSFGKPTVTKVYLGSRFAGEITWLAVHCANIQAVKLADQLAGLFAAGETVNPDAYDALATDMAEARWYQMSEVEKLHTLQRSGHCHQAYMLMEESWTMLPPSLQAYLKREVA